MREVIERHKETITLLIVVVIAVLVGELFSVTPLFVVLVSLAALFFLVGYDYFKLRYFGQAVQGPMNWLFTNETMPWVPNLHTVESRASDGSTIFVISDNLFLDAQNNETIETVSRNLKRGIKYAFITSDSPANAENIQLCIRRHENSPNLSVSTLPELVIRRRTLDNILVILDKRGTDSAYIQLPVGSEKWWAKLDQEHTAQVISNLHSYVRNENLSLKSGFDLLDYFRDAFSTHA